MTESKQKSLSLVSPGEAQAIMLEYVTSERQPNLDTMARNLNLPPQLLRELAKQGDWENERKAYHTAQTQEVLEQTSRNRAKANFNTLLKSVQLQGKVLDKVMTDIETGAYHPTIGEFIKLSETIDAVGKDKGSSVGFVGNNNKVVNISLSKPLNECSLEELVEIQQNVKGEILAEE